MMGGFLNTDFFQLSFLAVLQGITEFLPVSSSGHLILPSQLLGWPDQGLVFDVALHLGSLVAVLMYFREQLFQLGSAWLVSIRGGGHSPHSRLAWYLISASLPAGCVGFLLSDWLEKYSRSMVIIAASSMIFSLFLLIADRRGNERSPIELDRISFKTAIFIGFAQIFALIPGASRSGVTITAALFFNLSRQAASRFSFLLAIPIIAASGLLKSIDFYHAESSNSQWLVLLFGLSLSALVSYLCIHYFLKLIEKIGFLPFVIYRLLLGLILFMIYFFVL